jgi:uncharacterized protein (DUF3084 family)
MSFKDLCDDIHNQVNNLESKVSLLVKERDQAIVAKDYAIALRDSAIKERDDAIAERDQAKAALEGALKERPVPAPALAPPARAAKALIAPLRFSDPPPNRLDRKS